MHILHRFAAILDENKLGLPKVGTDGKIDDALQLVFAIMGAIALLVIALAGFRYVISQGNPSETAKAKNAIIYAGIGLVVAILAYSIITFVVKGVT
jgi:uncharacterized membrane protein YidH (DUF202 family)